MFSKIKVLQCLLDKCSEEEYSYSCHFCQTFYPIWCLGLIDCGCHLDRAVGWKMLKGMICAISLFCTSHMRGFAEKVVRGICFFGGDRSQFDLPNQELLWLYPIKYKKHDLLVRAA